MSHSSWDKFLKSYVPQLPNNNGRTINKYIKYDEVNNLIICKYSHLLEVSTNRKGSTELRRKEIIRKESKKDDILS